MISERAHELYGDRHWTDEELKQVVAHLEAEFGTLPNPGGPIRSCRCTGHRPRQHRRGERGEPICIRRTQW